jgi:phosphoribosylcarboxyaminoimidazole (NCAIR) mutase
MILRAGTVLGFYNDVNSAERAFDRIAATGIPSQDISVIASSHRGPELLRSERPEESVEVTSKELHQVECWAAHWAC